MPKSAAPPPPRRRRFTVMALILVVTAGVAAFGWHAADSWRNRANVGGMLGQVGQAVGQIGKEIEAAGEFSQQFVTDLAQDRVGEAYRRTSDVFRQKVSEERLTAFVRDHPTLRESPLRIQFTATKSSGGSVGRVTGSVTKISTNDKGQIKAGGDAAQVNLSLVDQQGALKVDQLAVGDQKLP